MTASEDESSDAVSSGASPSTRDVLSVAERALDVLVYFPAGALLTALEEMPETIAKGRARVDQELRNAKVVGRFAVGIGWRQVKEQIEWLAAEGRGITGSSPSTTTPETKQPTNAQPTTRTSRAPRAAGAGAARHEHRQPGSGRPRPATANSVPSAPRRVTPPRDPEVDRAIPDYDILAASQVVRRLDGLGHDELAAVVRHERATRSRRTILHRAEQLLGGAGGTSSPGMASGSVDPGLDPGSTA